MVKKDDQIATNTANIRHLQKDIMENTRETKEVHLLYVDTVSRIDRMPYEIKEAIAKMFNIKLVDHDSRLKKLENWRNGILGGAAVVSAIFAAFKYLL